MLPFRPRNGRSPETQGKLEADKRAALIARGQELRDQLAAVEEQLTLVGLVPNPVDNLAL
jgi:hypothetical protein